MYVWRAGSGGRIRIPLFFRARENVSTFRAAGPKKSEIGGVLSEPAALDHADRPKRYVWRVSARGIAWIRKIFRARENVSRCIAAARKKIGIGVILSEVDDFVVC